MLLMNPMPPHDNTKYSVICGAMCGMYASIQWQDIISTILLSVVGVLSSFGFSLLLQKFKNENLL